MFLTIKKLHMWLGLILGIILIAESVTGLILAEPWLAGQSHDKPQPRMEQRQSTEIKGSSNEMKEQRSSALGIAKGLHQGRYGDINFKWLIDNFSYWNNCINAIRPLPFYSLFETKVTT